MGGKADGGTGEGHERFREADADEGHYQAEATPPCTGAVDLSESRSDRKDLSLMPCALADCRNPEVECQHPLSGADEHLYDCPNFGRVRSSASFNYTDAFAEEPELINGLRTYIKSQNDVNRQWCHTSI